MLHKGADHTTIAMHDQPARKPLSSGVNRVTRIPSASLTGMSPMPQIALDEFPLRRLRRSSFRCLLLFLPLLVLVPSQTDRGEALEEAEVTFFRVVFLRQFAAPGPELFLSWKRKIFNARKPRCVGRALCWRRRNEDLSL